MTARPQKAGNRRPSRKSNDNPAIADGVALTERADKPDYRTSSPPLQDSVARALADWLARSVRDQAISSPYRALEMGNAFDAFEHELTQRDIDPRSKERYRSIVAAFRRWIGDRPLTSDACKDYLAARREAGYAQRSLLLYYHVLKQLLDADGQQLKMKMRRPHTFPPYYSRSDTERLIAQAERGLYHHTCAMRKRNTALVLVLAYTGLRKSELLDLRIGDVDFERRVLRVHLGKGGKDRTIPMAERIVVPLREQCGDRGPQQRVFADLTPRSVYRIVTRLARAAGLDGGFHPHSLRHFFATQLVERGGNLRAVQALLGHQSLETTAIYLDVSAVHLRETVALLDTAIEARPVT